ncbi:hypothetical protein PSP6_170123 [Paraburkholderia tropica]|nr:hypothetical protein PSP6_170123 [Paraburkholderia tropica]
MASALSACVSTLFSEYVVDNFFPFYASKTTASVTCRALPPAPVCGGKRSGSHANCPYRQ